MKSCLLTIIVYLLAIQCIKLFNYVCFNAFGPFFARAMLRRLSTGGFVIVGNTPIKPEKALGKMA